MEKELLLVVSENHSLSLELKKQISKRLYRLLKYNNTVILVDGIEKKLYEEVKINQKITFIIPSRPLKEWPTSSKKPLIYFENEHYLVVYKEANLMTIPTKAVPESLYQQLCFHLGSTPHIINRLDFATNGLVVVAKDQYSCNLLQPAHEHITRKYLCLVEGQMSGNGRIVNYIKKCATGNKREVCTEEEGQIAISNYRVLKTYDSQTKVEFTLETGRTHQIRLHCANMGHPIVGDSIYGDCSEGNLKLTSYYVEFIDPYTTQKIKIEIGVDF